VIQLAVFSSVLNDGHVHCRGNISRQLSGIVDMIDPGQHTVISIEQKYRGRVAHPILF
jgi:hypothetical protein